MFDLAPILNAKADFASIRITSKVVKIGILLKININNYHVQRIKMENF